MNKFFFLISSCFILNTNLGHTSEEQIKIPDNPPRKIDFVIKNIDFDTSRFQETTFRVSTHTPYYGSFEDQLNRCEQIISDALSRDKTILLSYDKKINEISDVDKIKKCYDIISTLAEQYRSFANSFEGLAKSLIDELPIHNYRYNLYGDLFKETKNKIEIDLIREYRKAKQQNEHLDAQPFRDKLEGLIIEFTKFLIEKCSEKRAPASFDLRPQHNPLRIYKTVLAKRNKFYADAQKLFEESLLTLAEFGKQEIKENAPQSLQNELEKFMSDFTEQLLQIHQQRGSESLRDNPLQSYEHATLHWRQSHLKEALRDLKTLDSFSIWAKNPYGGNIRTFFGLCENLILDLSDHYLYNEDYEYNSLIQNLFDQAQFDLNTLRRLAHKKRNGREIQHVISMVNEMLGNLLNNEQLKEIKCPIEPDYDPFDYYQKLQGQFTEILGQLELEEKKGYKDFLGKFIQDVGGSSTRSVEDFRYTTENFKFSSSYYEGSYGFTIQLPKIKAQTLPQSAFCFESPWCSFSITQQNGNRFDSCFGLPPETLLNPDVEKVLIEIRNNSESKANWPKVNYKIIPILKVQEKNEFTGEESFIDEMAKKWDSFRF